MLRDLVTRMLAEANPERSALEEPRENSLVLFFLDVDETDATYLQWLAERGLKYPARRAVPMFLRVTDESEPREPLAHEVAAMTLALEALNQFFSSFGAQLRHFLLPPEGIAHQVQVGSGAHKVAVGITFPPPGIELEPDEDWDEDDEEDTSLSDEDE